MSKNEETKKRVSVIDRTVDILTALSRSDMTSIRDLASQLNMSKSTTHRILQTLEERGLVRQDNETNKYSLGYKILELSTNIKKQDEIRNISYEHMEWLSEKIGETVQLAIIEDESILVIETVEGTNSLRLFAQPGERYPITYGNFGKIFLAYKSKEEAIKLIEENRLKKYASGSITDIDEYLNELEKVRNRKISVGIDDPIEGAISLAAPIFNSSNEVIASLSVVGVKTDYKLANLNELIEDTSECCTRISNEFK